MMPLRCALACAIQMRTVGNARIRLILRSDGVRKELDEHNEVAGGPDREIAAAGAIMS